MRKTLVGTVLGAATLAILGSGCVVRGYATTPTVQADAYIPVDTAPTYTVQAYPPEPQYEVVTASPGYGYVWIDGSWNWNGYQWAWTSGRWVPERQGYVYVSPYYDYVGGQYVYRAGYWGNRQRLGNVEVYDHRDGRPATYVEPRRAPVNQRYRYDVVDHRGQGGAYQPPVVDHRGQGGGYNPGGNPGYDHRGQGGGGYNPGASDPGHDHRGGGYQPPPRPTAPDNQVSTDHRHPAGGGGYQPPPRPTAPNNSATTDHRNPNAGGGYQPPPRPTAPHDHATSGGDDKKHHGRHY